MAVWSSGSINTNSLAPSSLPPRFNRAVDFARMIGPRKSWWPCEKKPKRESKSRGVVFTTHHGDPTIIVSIAN
jgi:hypothetical protein